VDYTTISKELVVPMDEIATGIKGLRIAFVNVFAVRGSESSWTLIDAGLPFTATLIRNWAEEHFVDPPVAILLTHGHFDHVSGATELAEHWNVPIYAHFLEAPYLSGEEAYPPPDVGAGGGLMSLLSPIYPRGPVDLGPRLQLLGALGEGTEVPGLNEWRVIHTPGHTPGHVSLFRPADRALIVGDAFCTTKPESFFDAAICEPPELHGPPAYFTSDWASAQRSVRRLVSLRPDILIPGHGRPLAGKEVEWKFEEFADAFAGDSDRRAA
jgi:glyoxylase-like metal-dependent hydrolase (beta-lactamase superfamily II)